MHPIDYHDVTTALSERLIKRNSLRVGIRYAGEAVIHCHGVKLQPEEAEETDEEHKIFVERIYFYCNRSGLFYLNPIVGIDDRESGYDDSEERRELEKAARMLFG